MDEIEMLLDQRRELIKAITENPSDTVSLELLSKNTWRLIALGEKNAVVE